MKEVDSYIMNNTQNKNVALITGATGEIGSAISLLLAQNKIDLILHYYSNYEKIKSLEQECKQYGINIIIKKADMRDINDINNLFDFIKKESMNPNIVINAVGKAHYGLIQDVKHMEWVELVNTNIMSTFFCCQKAIPEMIKQRYGRIINISSIWGEVGSSNEVLYSMTKGAINSFTKSLAKELAPTGITVNAIAPGVVLSKMMAGFAYEELEEIKKEIPMLRFAKTIEIAQTVLHLIHSNSGYITGQVINIDGGLVLN